jgi:hypothetical protein
MAFVPVRGLSSLRDIEKAAALAKEAIGRVPTGGLELPHEAVEKLRWLANGGREFREVNRTLKGDMQVAFTSALRDVMKGKAKVTEPWRAAIEAYRDRIATRIALGGGDIKAHLKRLKPVTIKRKGHSKIGVDSGEMLRQVSAAKVKVR